MINLLSSIITSQHVSLLVAVGYIIYSILCGVMTCILLKAKGYSGIFFPRIIWRSGGNFVRNRNADLQR